MKKKLITSIILFATTIAVVHSSSRYPRFDEDIDYITNRAKTQTPINSLDLIHANYAKRTTNQEKLQYISSIVDNTTLTIEDKIQQLELLDKVLASDISLHAGWIWFWNSAEDQVQIDWLQDKRDMIAKRISELRWQGRSYGFKTAVSAAKYAAIYAGIILAAYLAKDQYAKLTGDKNIAKLSYGDIATLPISTLFEMATAATIGVINTVSGPTAQNIASTAYYGTKAVGQTGYNLLESAGNALTTSVPANIKDSAHNIALNVAVKTMPTQKSKLIVPTQNQQTRSIPSLPTSNNAQKKEEQLLKLAHPKNEKPLQIVTQQKNVSNATSPSILQKAATTWDNYQNYAQEQKEYNQYEESLKNTQDALKAEHEAKIKALEYKQKLAQIEFANQQAQIEATQKHIAREKWDNWAHQYGLK